MRTSFFWMAKERLGAEEEFYGAQLVEEEKSEKKDRQQIEKRLQPPGSGIGKTPAQHSGYAPVEKISQYGAQGVEGQVVHIGASVV